jgi:hypothetical protein
VRVYGSQLLNLKNMFQYLWIIFDENHFHSNCFYFRTKNINKAKKKDGNICGSHFAGRLFWLLWPLVVVYYVITFHSIQSEASKQEKHKYRVSFKRNDAVCLLAMFKATNRKLYKDILLYNRGDR